MMRTASGTNMIAATILRSNVQDLRLRLSVVFPRKRESRQRRISSANTGSPLSRRALGGLKPAEAPPGRRRVAGTSAL
jgi:hypothetical protein